MAYAEDAKVRLNLHLIHLKGLNEETQENINVTNTRIEKSIC